MSRELSDSIDAISTAKSVDPFFTIDIDFDSGPLYIHSGVGNLVIGSKTYIGVGNLLSIGELVETADMQAVGTTIAISGIPSSYVSLALSEPYQGRDVRIYLGSSASSSDYTEIYSGQLDQMNLEDSAEYAIIEVTVENELIRLERPTIRRLTLEDQKTRYPDDLGLEFVTSLKETDMEWGKV